MLALTSILSPSVSSIAQKKVRSAPAIPRSYLHTISASDYQSCAMIEHKKYDNVSWLFKASRHTLSPA